MLIYNVANGDESAYYSGGYETRAEAMELLRIAIEHDPKAHVVMYETQSEVERLRAELEQVKRERDAAVHDLRNFSLNVCLTCGHRIGKTDCAKFGKRELEEGEVAIMCGQYEWRGLCKENGGSNNV